jgi:NNP family nitrate/nitrite transporter-like MFS transporter
MLALSVHTLSPSPDFNQTNKTPGGELAINSIIGSYYLKNFPRLGQTGSGRWAAMFGLLNVVFRPMGGVISDIIYKYTKSVWAKKLWIVFCGVSMGCFELAIGLANPHHEATMFGLVAGLAVFMDASNGANFAVVPHVHPFANGILSGIVGATGNFGGIVFAVIFRYNGAHYAKVIWIIGAISIGVNLACSWIRPVPRGQIGGQ